MKKPDVFEDIRLRRETPMCVFIIGCFRPVLYTLPRMEDPVEPEESGIAKDGPLTTSAHKRLLLESIRNKIRQGFYASGGVTEDVSDKLARLFDR